MLHFNELYITEDKQHLVIDVEIDDLPIYDDCYLEKITVDVAESCGGDGLFTNPKYEWEFEPEVPGDINGDKLLDEKDRQFWLDMMRMAPITRDSIHSRINADGKIEYYYRANGDEYEVTPLMLDVYDKAAALYTDPMSQTTPAEDMSFKLLPYIADLFNDTKVYETYFGHPYDPTYKKYDFL